MRIVYEAPKVERMRLYADDVIRTSDGTDSPFEEDEEGEWED